MRSVPAQQTDDTSGPNSFTPPEGLPESEVAGVYLADPESQFSHPTNIAALAATNFQVDASFEEAQPVTPTPDDEEPDPPAAQVEPDRPSDPLQIPAAEPDAPPAAQTAAQPPPTKPPAAPIKSDAPPTPETENQAAVEVSGNPPVGPLAYNSHLTHPQALLTSL